MLCGMKIKALYRYPCKSLPGIEVSRMTLDGLGPAGDRRWMLVDDTGRFVTQRTFPQLALVRVHQPKPTAAVEVAVPGEGWLALHPTDKPCSVDVWSDTVPAVEGSVEACEAMSRFLERPIKWVFMNEAGCRRVSAQWVERDCSVSFADGFPFLVTTTGSLRQLERWSGRSLDRRRFRPGIIVDCPEPFAEDSWRELRIGAVALRLVKPCTRCRVTTIDPDTALPDPHQEPLRTLGRYRRTASGVIFGVNAVHEGSGTLSVGDDVVAVNADGEVI